MHLRFASGLLLASALTIAQAVPAFAQASSFHSPIGPGEGPVRGVTLEDAVAALQAATKTDRTIGVAPDGSATVTGHAVTSVFIPSAAALVVMGDDLDNTITVSRDAAGKLLVNGGAVVVAGGTATVANTAVIEIFGLGGNDTLELNEANGALPGALMFGGTGNDVLVGGSSVDQLFGQAGNDTLLGKGGNDFLFGGDGNDTLTGGDGNDQVFGQAGNDRLIWNPGDDTDLNEGGDGLDVVEVNGGNGSEIFTAAPNGTRVRFDRLQPAPFTLDIGTTESLVVNMNGGDDSFSGSNGLAALINLLVDGGAGNDTITGGDGNDVLLGGDGNDTIVAGRGNDTVLMGAGDDTFVWNPGDGSDTVEGQSGLDRLTFNGANIAETVNLSANGSRVRLTRDVANIVMDLNEVETIDLNELGGADQTTVNDLSGTGVSTVNLDLAASGGVIGDGAADLVFVNGTAADDVVLVTGDTNGVSVLGLSASVNILHAEVANDVLTVATLAGDDVIEATGLAAGAITLHEDGGDGNDVLIGSAGADTLLGGAGDDILIGGPGQDVLDGGAGNNVLLQ